MTTLNEKAKAIKLMILDVDGVLTNGTLIYSKDAIDYKAFSVKDGLGISMLRKSGVEVAIITACVSDIIKKRAEHLGLRYVYEGCVDKLQPYLDLKEQLKLQDSEIAYMGDDLPDLAIIRRVGLGMTVADAPKIIQEHAAYVSKFPGGQGAVREVCELIMEAQGSFAKIVEEYLQR